MFNRHTLPLWGGFFYLMIHFYRTVPGIREVEKQNIVKGGPPPPTRFCTACGKELMGLPKHCKDAEDNLFCDHVCRDNYKKRDSKSHA
jgi:hypothetical protein